jgi:hypothetical protein
VITSYLIWYRLVGDDHDRIAGVSHSLSAGIDMAEKIYAIKKVIDKLPVISTGVKLCRAGMLYSNEICEQRWQATPLKTSGTKNPGL